MELSRDLEEEQMRDRLVEVGKTVFLKAQHGPLMQRIETVAKKMAGSVQLGGVSDGLHFLEEMMDIVRDSDSDSDSDDGAGYLGPEFEDYTSSSEPVPEESESYFRYSDSDSDSDSDDGAGYLGPEFEGYTSSSEPVPEESYKQVRKLKPVQVLDDSYSKNVRDALHPTQREWKLKFAEPLTEQREYVLELNE